jgi:hypothetical protein
MADFMSERQIAIQDSKRIQKAKKESQTSVAWKEDLARQLAVAVLESINSSKIGAARKLVKSTSDAILKMRQHWLNERGILTCQNQACRIAFSLNERKHHCRICGKVFCDGCSPKQLELMQFLPEDVSDAYAEDGGLRFYQEDDEARGLERCCGECFKDLSEYRAQKDMRSKLEGAGTHVLCNLYSPIPAYMKGIDATLEKLKRAILYLDRITELATGPDAIELTEMAIADVQVIKVFTFSVEHVDCWPC